MQQLNIGAIGHLPRSYQLTKPNWQPNRGTSRRLSHGNRLACSYNQPEQLAINGLPPPKQPTSGLFYRRFGIEIEQQHISMDALKEIVQQQVQGQEVPFESDFGKLVTYAIADSKQRIWSLLYDGNNTEVSSPILHDQHDLQLVQNIASQIQKLGGKAGLDSGLHVHIDATGLSKIHVAQLVQLLNANQHWLYPLLGVHPLRRLNYCKPMPEQDFSPAIMQANDLDSMLSTWGRTRFRGLNIQNFCFKEQSKYTMEFRYFNGTLEPAMIGFAVGFSMNMVAYTLETKRHLPPTTLPALLGSLTGIVCGIAPSWCSLWPTSLAQIITNGQQQLQQKGLLRSPSCATTLQAMCRDDAFVTQLCQCLRSDGTESDVAELYQFLVTKPYPLRQHLVEQLQSLHATCAAQADILHILQQLYDWFEHCPGPVVSKRYQLIQAVAPLTTNPAAISIINALAHYTEQELSAVSQVLQGLAIAPAPTEAIPHWFALVIAFRDHQTIWPSIVDFCHYLRYAPNKAEAHATMLQFRDKPIALKYFCTNFCLLDSILPRKKSLHPLVQMIANAADKPPLNQLLACDEQQLEGLVK